MSKKIIAILLCVTLILSLAGCGGTTYSFDGVGGPTSAVDVENNNSNIVFADGYAYFVGSSVAYTSANTFGEVESGAIYRQNLATGEVVMLQSKLVADQNGVGLAIYGDKLYYTSPSDEVDRDGNSQYYYLDIMVCNLDGSDPEKLYTFGGTPAMVFDEADGVVYAVYEQDGEIRSIDLSSAGNSSKVIATDYTSGVSTKYGMFLLRTVGVYNEVYAVSPTGEETLVISGVSGDENFTISIVDVRDEKIYYSKTDSIIAQTSTVYSCNLDGSNDVAITTLSVAGSVYTYGEGYIFAVGTDIFYKNGNEFVLLDNSGTSNFKVEGGYLFIYSFTDGFAPLYKIDIDAKIDGTGGDAVLMFGADEDSAEEIYQTSFSTLTLHDGVGYYYSSLMGYELRCFDVTGTTSSALIP